ncbi:hypothetical protein QJS04_geneDACA000636 [Acorus gramineus]|uniref:Uncharacterized protein n=1 Tax=Acorus gramineus TaxID=55184 RepID=A0AAV9AU30_ACOGR|nr:hypothetical protein QJS04_geneDACA000636 [Acorus gramineus]
MARVRAFWIHCRTVALIWISSAILFLSLFEMASRNARRLPPPGPGSGMPGEDQRSRLYDKMERDLEEQGAVFLGGGETSQSLSLSDIFSVKNGSIAPVLKVADPPVRATVLHLSTDFSVPISQAVRSVFLPYFDNGEVLFSNFPSLSFSTLETNKVMTINCPFLDEIEAEADAIKAVAEAFCPLKIVLDRVIFTPTGVLLGCWQVISGTDPLIIRAKLRDALPHAPQKQFYDPVMLHTSFARLLGHPNIQATVSELWFVEELDVLALALNGRIKVHRFRLSCSTKKTKP